MSPNKENIHLTNWEIVSVNPTNKNWNWKDIFCFWTVGTQSIISFALLGSLYLLYNLNFYEVLFGSFSSLSQIITFAPDLRNLFVISKPKPCAPPVTIATFFFKSNLFIFHLLAGNKQYLKQQNQ